MSRLTRPTLVAPLHTLAHHDGRTAVHALALDGDEDLHVGDQVRLVDEEHPGADAIVEDITVDGYVVLLVSDIQ